MYAKTIGAFLALVATLPALAIADDVDCTGELGEITVDGNVLVAAPCELTGTIVKGNIELFEGGALTARNVDVVGNIQAANAASADVTDSTIGGSVQLDDLTGEIAVARNDITGSIQVVGNWSAIGIAGNFVGADIQAFSNTGGVDITGNTVDGNLQCKENDPAPTGSDNLVQGNKEDQCENLSPADADPGTTPVPANTGNSSSGGENAAAADSGGGGAMHPLMLAGLMLLAGSAFGSRRKL